MQGGTTSGVMAVARRQPDMPRVQPKSSGGTNAAWLSS
jgi:hypothetical protein